MQFGERAAGNWCRRKQMNTEDQPDTQCGKSLKEIEHAVTDLDNNSARSSAVVDPFLDGGVSPCLTIEPSNPRGVDNEFIRRPDGARSFFCVLRLCHPPIFALYSTHDKLYQSICWRISKQTSQNMWTFSCIRAPSQNAKIFYMGE